MGFFKSIGNKLKRAISIKNLVNVGTGNFTAVSQDLVRIAGSTDPKKGASQSDVTLVPKGFVIPEQAADIIKAQGDIFGRKTQDMLAKSGDAQAVNKWFTGLWFKTQWELYKSYILFFVGLIVAFFAWRHFRKPKGARVAKRR
ncbi:hypothetical protein ACM55H_11625 [Flavobacterium sp. ZT3R17]|uniref:hypothetical protein n=1 Tax=Flavobacterium cryoconiti TaxID=3398736 RepID=UPI003A8A5D84